MTVPGNPCAIPPRQCARAGECTLQGLAASRGAVSGPVFILANDGFPESVPEHSIAPRRVPSETARYEEARKTTRRQIEALENEMPGGAGAAVFEGHLMLLEDELLDGEIRRRISDGLINAEAAVHGAILHFRRMFERMTDRYMRERAADLEDLGKRLVGNLAGRPELRFDAIQEPSVIVAEDLSPSETIALPKGLVLGFATDRGSVTSHVALLARALGIPAVVGLGDATSHVKPGGMVALDGDRGELIVSPSAATVESFAERSRSLASGGIAGESGARGPARLADGRTVNLLANMHDGIPLVNIHSFGACGVGLYRSEYLWLDGASEPSENEQAAAYSRVARYVSAAVSPEAETVIRALDIGGDKIMPGSGSEPNPFLGNRSIRFLLSNRSVLRTQLRAILRASASARVAVMYPMVATVEELHEANLELSCAMTQLAFAGIPFDRDIRRGVMIELPSAALNAAAFAREVDFFSIGTNDLVQYTMGADRGNEAVAYLYQPVNPAVLKLVDMTVCAAEDAGIPVAVCGESASDPVIAAVWTALGVSELSMSCSYIPVIRRALSALPPGTTAELARLVRSMWDGGSGDSIYAAARDFLVSRVSDPDVAAVFAPPAP